jgi:hypothetical protein
MVSIPAQRIRKPLKIDADSSKTGGRPQPFAQLNPCTV